MQQLIRYVEKQWIDKSTVGPSRLSIRDNQARTNNAVESFHASLRRHIKVPHHNLFAFLGHLQKTTIDSQSDVSRITSSLPIRRAKKRVILMNDKRIKICMERFDNTTYTRLHFLRAVSHAVGSDKIIGDNQSDADDNDDDDDTEDEDDCTIQAQNAAGNSNDDASTPLTVSAAAVVDSCEVCFVAPAPRNARFALMPCGHQRFYQAIRRAPTQSMNKAVAVLCAARPSQWCCVCTNCTCL